MQAYADRAWDEPVDPRSRPTDLFHLDRAPQPHTLLDQAAMVQIYALLGWPAERYGLLA